MGHGDNDERFSKIKIRVVLHAISWFEIPATDLDPMSGIGGALVDNGCFHKPSGTDGPLIYLNGNPDLQKILDKVEGAGGKVMLPKTEISPEYGYMGVFFDTEGNRIGLHCVPEKYL